MAVAALLANGAKFVMFGAPEPLPEASNARRPFRELCAALARAALRQPGDGPADAFLDALAYGPPPSNPGRDLWVCKGAPIKDPEQCRAGGLSYHQQAIIENGRVISRFNLAARVDGARVGLHNPRMRLSWEADPAPARPGCPYAPAMRWFAERCGVTKGHDLVPRHLCARMLADMAARDAFPDCWGIDPFYDVPSLLELCLTKCRRWLKA